MDNIQRELRHHHIKIYMHIYDLNDDLQKKKKKLF